MFDFSLFSSETKDLTWHAWAHKKSVRLRESYIF